MPLSSVFKLRDAVTPEIISLLEQTTLGTNGSKYKHKDTSSRIYEADHPLFLSMERNENVIGNITFCRRDRDWYIRYFAFHSLAQAGEKKKKEEKGNSFLKRELNTFFEESFSGLTDGKPVRSMYAYIDPKNDRSKWMSENFGFSVIRQLSTQSFSRINPKPSERLKLTDNWESVEPMVIKTYGEHSYFFTTHANKAPFYILENSQGEVIACAKVTRVNWEIVRLPGKMGGLLTKFIPYIPGLNKLIKPKHHTFLVPEIVCIDDSNADLLSELFEAILYREKLNLILWWIDSKDPLYTSVKDKVKWGLLHKMIGVAPVDVVQRTSEGSSIFTDRPVFVTAFDMV